MKETSIEGLFRFGIDMKTLHEMQKKWETECMSPALAKEPHGKSEVETDIGITVKSLYTPLDLANGQFDYIKSLGFPGQYPFTRGISPILNRDSPWVIRAYSGFGEASECNRRYRKLIQWGVDEIVMAVDLPTQVGYDSDALMANGEVGKVGVAIDTLRDMEILFDGISLAELKRVSMLGNSFGPIALSLFIALGEKQGLKPSEFVIDLQNDVLKEYIARGTYIFPIRPAVRLTTDVVAYCAENLPHWRPLTLCANHINAAGAGSSVATAFAIANGICYIESLLEKGLNIDTIAPLLTMFLDERADFFAAVSNFRATRRVWADLMKNRLNAQDSKSQALHITAYAHGGETLKEPLNNIARITLASLAYVFGGVQYLYNASWDEVLRLPDENAAKLAIRTQQILAHELGITNTIDPLGGSYFIEDLTNQIEEQIKAELLKVLEIGGAIKAIEDGYYTSLINDGAIRRQYKIEKGDIKSIGVNKYVSEEKIQSSSSSIDTNYEKIQIRRLKKVKTERNSKKVQETLDYVREVAMSDNNIVPPVLEAVRAYASIGEICTVLRGIWGEYQKREYFGKAQK